MVWGYIGNFGMSNLHTWKDANYAGKYKQVLDQNMHLFSYKSDENGTTLPSDNSCTQCQFLDV